MGMAYLQEAVMQMHLVGTERAPTCPGAPDDGEQKVEDRNEHHCTDEQKRRQKTE